MSRADLKAFVREIVADQFDDIAVVFDDKDAFHAVRAYRTPAWRQCTVGRRIAVGMEKILNTRDLT